MKIITVEHLSKYYTIGHDRNSGVIRYKTFRESMMSAGRSLYQRLRHPLSPNREQVELEEFRALDDVSFEVEQGDRIGIIGRNGAGKSTLLKLLCRITEPTKGRITMRGRVASLLEVGTGFHPELSGRENIYLNGAILGMKRAEIKRKFDEIVAFSGVEKFLDTPVKRYSSGMYVRLAFAVAAHLESEILLIDEVLAVGDAEFQKKCLGKMDDISKTEGRTILFVSHNMGIISSLCNKGLLLDHGQNYFAGNISNTISRYGTLKYDYSDNPVNLSLLPRTHGMKNLLKSLELRNQRGEITTTFLQSDSIIIKITYSAPQDIYLSGAGFFLQRIDGIQVCGYNTYMAKPPPYQIPNKGNLTWKIPPKVFTPGIFLLTVSLGLHQTQLIDKVFDVIQFTVTQSDVYETGYMLSSEDGVFALYPETVIEDYSK